MRRIILILALILIMPIQVQAEKILFIPHDDRPISYNQTVQVVKSAGYEIILPPKEFLSNATNMGNSDELWKWLFENAPTVSSAVISSDSMLYGGLIPSRKHDIPQEIINERLDNFKKLREENFGLKIYVFDSLMRTPITGTKGDIEEPEYYAEYGGDIFQYTRLTDKKEISKLSKSEERYFEYLENKIPAEHFEDWMSRRAKNLSATKKLMDYLRDDIIDYLVLGRDDNSPLSQTHRENREIIKYAEQNDLSKTKFQSVPGIDEFNILLLNRAINDITSEIPFVNIIYNRGKGGDTIPAFSDEKISKSIDSALTIAGCLRIPSAERADFVLLVNTDYDGRTLWGHNLYPTGNNMTASSKVSDDTEYFAEIIEECIAKNYSTGIADINFANGSDNALMKLLQEKNLLYKLTSYSGWNTATNSTGFAIGTGILAKKINDSDKQKLLTVRYLDDWAYQANVRTVVGNEIVENFHEPSLYYQLGDKLSWAENRNTELMRDFAEKNLPHFDFLKNFIVKNPWLRMFECDIIFS